MHSSPDEQARQRLLSTQSLHLGNHRLLPSVAPSLNSRWSFPLSHRQKCRLTGPDVSHVYPSGSCINHPACQYLDKIWESYKHCKAIPTVFFRGVRMVEE